MNSGDSKPIRNEVRAIPPQAQAPPVDAERWRRQAARHGLVALILVIGATLTVGLSYTPIGGTRAQVVAALAIAIVQAGCVGWVSMHLKDAPESICKPLLLTLVVVAALFALSVLGLADRAHY